ncbi:MAG: hypothetical protein ACE37B_22440 [Ilumatobacter sp.]|uniref:hypothetical protein n=1 Tax=Ilumatobacter sp. TaxID=1967498 RepID=UPI00391D8A39
MIRLDAATVLLQWATGGMLFCWFTTRRRVVGLGYGWLLRGVYFCFAIGAFAAGLALGVNPVREGASLGVAAACLVGLGVSIARKSAGVSGQQEEFDRRSERVAAMTGIERTTSAADSGGRDVGGVGTGESGATTRVKEFPPVLDLVPALIGMVGLIAAAIDAGGNTTVALLRTLIGAAFIGAISDGMLLGHWYLVQPGLPRRLLNELVTALAWLWPLEVGALLLPTGMISVWVGTVDDGWGGLLGWMWGACALTTIILVMVTKAALRERYYSAVMAATGLLYLAILTAFGTDIVARAVLDQT